MGNGTSKSNNENANQANEQESSIRRSEKMSVQSQNFVSEIQEQDFNIIIIDPNDSLKAQLQPITKQLQHFLTVEQFIKKVKPNAKGALFVIFSNPTEASVQKIHDWPNIIHILVCQRDFWASKFPKIKLVNDNNFLPFFKSVKRILDDNNLKKETPLQFQTLKLSVANTEESFNYARDDFVDFAKAYIADNGDDIDNEKLDDFISNFQELKSIREKKIITWFIGESFLNQMVNKTLRKGNLLEIFKLRFVLFTLQKQLHEFQLEQFEETVLYRGTAISKSQLAHWKSKANQPIQMLGLVSTSSSEQIAMIFMKLAYNRIANQKDYVQVLFEIEVQEGLQYRPIRLQSFDPSVSEFEYLMDLNTILILKSYEEEPEYGFVRLKTKIHQGLQNNNSVDQVQQLDHFKVAELFESLGMNNELVALLKDFKCDLLQEPVRLLKLGQAYEKLLQLQMSLKHYNQAIDLLTKANDIDSLMLALKLQGSCLYTMGQIEEAKEIYLKLVDFRKQKSLRNLNSATCYNDLGVICERLCQFEDAFKYKQMAMEIIESCEGDNDELKVTIYNNLGIAYENMQNFSEGTKFKEKALKLAIENFGENDIKTANTYNNLGISYENLGEYGKALEWKLKAHKIYECSVEVNQKELAIIKNNLGVCYDRLGDFTSGHIYKEKAFDMSSTQEKDLDYYIMKNNFGISCEHIGEHGLGEQHKIECLERIKCLNQSESSLQVIFLLNNLGVTYQVKALEDEENSGYMDEAYRKKIQALEKLEELQIKESVVLAHLKQSLGHYHLEAFHMKQKKFDQRKLQEEERKVEFQPISRKMYEEVNFSEIQSLSRSDSSKMIELEHLERLKLQDSNDVDSMKKHIRESIKLFNEGRDIYGRILGESHPSTQIAGNYVDVLQKEHSSWL